MLWGKIRTGLPLKCAADLRDRKKVKSAGISKRKHVPPFFVKDLNALNLIRRKL
jgi:hypothetical protein